MIAFEILIESNGFVINAQKCRLQSRRERQEVTGLVVNKRANVRRIYIRNIRAALHAWKKYGYEKAQKFYEEQYKKERPRSGNELRYVLKGRLEFISAVRGRDDSIYQKYLRELYNLDPSLFNEKEYQTKLLPMSSMDDEKISRALWVLESNTEIEQGSAFFLRGYGLVTCAHVAEKTSFAYQTFNPGKKYLFKIEKKNESLDLAILSIQENVLNVSLDKGDSNTANITDSVVLAGFPQKGFGDSHRIVWARIAQKKTLHGVNYLLIDQSIIEGNSGGPLLAADGKVVGVAARGAATPTEAMETVEHGAIEINQIDSI